MSALSEATGLNPLDDIESTLRTDVVDILRACLEALTDLDRGAAYEKVMNEPNLLHDSFTLLRREPALFAKVIVDDKGRSVEARDESRLRCGETLGYIKTLILRASARRHFRRKLGGYRTVMVESNRQIGPVRAMLQRFGVLRPPPQRKRKLPGRGDTLYRAMREYLLFDWQASLIPHYVQLTPELVDELGVAILEVREPAELRVLAGEEGRKTLSTRQRPLFLSGARNLMQVSGDTIDADILWKLWEQLGLNRLFEQCDMAECRKIIAEVAATSKSAIQLLMPTLGEDIRLFIVFLFIAYRQLGRIDFRNTFHESGATQWMANTFADRLSQMHAQPVPELSEMIQAYSAIMTTPAKMS